ncbi:hypothetical protein ACLOJK_008812 [Asimina triloba]
MHRNTFKYGRFVFARPKYNATLAWEVPFAFFDDEKGWLNAYRLPAKCKSLGLCEDEMCVACPQPQGLLGWSRNCSVPKVAAASCKKGGLVEYYKVAGVENFITAYVKSSGAMNGAECKKKCSQDCSCAGYFYWEESSRCWLAPMIGTLEKVSIASHGAYIKYT